MSRLDAVKQQVLRELEEHQNRYVVRVPMEPDWSTVEAAHRQYAIGGWLVRPEVVVQNRLRYDYSCVQIGWEENTWAARVLRVSTPTTLLSVSQLIDHPFLREGQPFVLRSRDGTRARFYDLHRTVFAFSRKWGCWIAGKPFEPFAEVATVARAGYAIETHQRRITLKPFVPRILVRFAPLKSPLDVVLTEPDWSLKVSSFRELEIAVTFHWFLR